MAVNSDAEPLAYLLEWDPARVWDADFNIWLDAGHYGAVWSPANTAIPTKARELGRLRFHGVHSVVADDDYPPNDLGWPIVSQAMLDVLQSVGDFDHEAFPIDVVDAGADAADPPALDQRFAMLHLGRHLDEAYLDPDGCVGRRVPGIAGIGEMLSAPSAIALNRDYVAANPLPPVFRLAIYPWGPVVSAAARAALEAAGIRSLRFVPLDHLPDAHFRSQLLDPWSLERMVVESKPDQGLDRFFRVLRSPNCDRATALRIYWTHGPTYFQRFATEKEIPPQQRTVHRLLGAVERRYAAGMYKLRVLYFNPNDDAGFDWTAQFVEPGVPRHYALPEVMLEPTGVKPTEALSPQQRLFRVVADGDRRAAQQLVMSGDVDLEATQDDEYGDTALHLAVRHGHTELVELLVFEGADLNAYNRLRHAPLHIAAAAGDVVTAKALLDGGADIDALAHSDRPVQLAARGGHADMVRLLLDNAASLSGIGSVLHDACEGRSVAVLDLLLARGGSTDTEDVRGDTPLMTACLHGWLDGAQRLLAGGASLSRENTQTGATALHAAARGDHADVVRWLLAEGADRTVTDRLGQLPLHVALRDGGREAAAALLDGAQADATAALSVAMSWEGADWPAVEVLLAHGADAAQALRIACTFAFGDIVDKLVAKPGLDATAADDQGRTALHLLAGCQEGDASDEERAAIVATLAPLVALDAVDGGGATSLHYAAAAGYAAVVEALVTQGADATLKTTGPFVSGDASLDAGATAGDVAKAVGYESLASRLEEAGAP